VVSEERIQREYFLQMRSRIWTPINNQVGALAWIAVWEAIFLPGWISVTGQSLWRRVTRQVMDQACEDHDEQHQA
jgi:hypothetical protein